MSKRLACGWILRHAVRNRQPVQVVVIAIGGSASVGKTTLATDVSRALGLGRVVHVDDLRGASFIDSMPDVWQAPAARLLDSLIAETERTHGVIAAEIDALVTASSSGLIEGEGVEPRLLHRWPRTHVRSAYVIEDDADRLRETFARRPSARFLSLSRDEQAAVVEMNRGYGAWLRQEADSRNQAWVPSQPWDTLAERVMTALELPTRDRLRS